MEFNEKLQNLRKKNNISQQELAQKLYVSRAAISKWESGRGYPSIDSLKRIANVFSISVDELLSSNELLCLAEQNTKQKENNFRDLIFGLLDVCFLLLLFLPLFAQNSNDAIKAVSLLQLNSISTYMQAIYYVIVITILLFGIMILALQNLSNATWQHIKYKISLLLNIISVMVFIISLQPYASIFVFSFLIIKILVLTKKQ